MGKTCESFPDISNLLNMTPARKIRGLCGAEREVECEVPLSWSESAPPRISLESPDRDSQTPPIPHNSHPTGLLGVPYESPPRQDHATLDRGDTVGRPPVHFGREMTCKGIICLFRGRVAGTIPRRGSMPSEPSPSEATLVALRSSGDQEPLMSHFTLRVGHFFHDHPFAHFHVKALTKPARPSPGIEPQCEPAHSGDLAFFGLCRETNHDDHRAEMDRLSLMDQGDERLNGLDENILFLL